MRVNPSAFLEAKSIVSPESRVACTLGIGAPRSMVSALEFVENNIVIARSGSITDFIAFWIVSIFRSES